MAADVQDAVFLVKIVLSFVLIKSIEFILVKHFTLFSKFNI